MYDLFQFCSLCKFCISDSELYMLKRAYLEHVNRKQFQRIYPRPFGVSKIVCSTCLIPIPTAISDSSYFVRSIVRPLVSEWVGGWVVE